MKTIGEKIYYQRRKLHLTQEKFSELVGVSRQTIYQWENDLQIPKTDKMLKICEIFSVEMSYFYTDVSSKDFENESLPAVDSIENPDEKDDSKLETIEDKKATVSNKKKKLTKKQVGAIVLISIALLIVITIVAIVLCLYTYEEEGFETVHIVEFGISQAGVIVITTIALAAAVTVYLIVIIKMIKNRKTDK